jgi:hypothetical protein
MYYQQLLNFYRDHNQLVLSHDKVNNNFDTKVTDIAGCDQILFVDLFRIEYDNEESYDEMDMAFGQILLDTV